MKVLSPWKRVAAGNSEFEVFMELSNYRLYDSGVRVL